MPLSELQVTWSTPVPAGFWEAAEAVGKPIKSARTKNLRAYRIGPTLPEPDRDDMVVYVTVAGVSPGRESDEKAAERKERLGWFLHLHRSPSADPPKWVTSGSERVGGRVGLAKFLQAQNPTPRPNGRCEAEWRFPCDAWECTVLPGALSDGDPGLEVDGAAAIESVGYRFPSAPGGVQQVTVAFDHESDAYIAGAIANLAIDPGAGCEFTHVLAVFDNVVARFFQERGAGRP